MNPSKSLRIGLLFSQTGLTSYIESTQIKAAKLAISELQPLLLDQGINIEIIEHDTCSSPEIAAHVAERMLFEENVDFIIGCYMSSTRQAIVSLVERSGKLLLYPSPYEGFEYSQNVIYGGAVPNQHIMMLVRYLSGLQKKRYYCVGSRYIFPIESNRVLTNAVLELGGEVVREKYVGMIATQREFDEIIADIKAQAPDVLFLTVVGQSFAPFCRQMHAANLLKDTLVVGLTATEAEVQMVGAEYLKGHITAATYFQSCDSPQNSAFLADYAAAYGSSVEVNCMAETAYSATKITLCAIAEAGSAQPRQVLARMAARTYDTPQGAVTFDKDTHHFHLWPRVAQVNGEGRFEILCEAPTAIAPDPYLEMYDPHVEKDDDPSFSYEMTS